MENALRAHLIDWLRTDPALAGQLNAIAEEAPLRTAPPWLGLVASASADWSTKDRKGREVRVALELQCRTDSAADTFSLATAIEDRVESLPPAQPGFRVAGVHFLRARVEQRPGNLRALLIEYRFRLMAN